MMPEVVTLCLAALCLMIIYSDLRYMRIPDWISLSTIALYALSIAIQYPDVAIGAQVLLAAVTFLICFALFAARIMGGGDAKVIPALALFVPPAFVGQIMLLFAACLALTIGMSVPRRFFTGHPLNDKLPMGGAIGLTGLIALSLGY